ncbi:MAG: PKD domain-containing protein [Bacteroidota bacterium]
MKKIYTLLLVVGFALSTQAQTTYQSSDYAGIGDNYVISISNGNLINYDYTLNGANQSWVFDSIPINEQGEEVYEDPDNAGYFLSYIAACVLDGGNIFSCPGKWNDLTNLARQNPFNLNLGAIEFTDVVDHYDKTSTTLEATILGMTAGSNGLSIPLAIEYDDIDTLYRFPIAYQNQDSATGSYSFDLTPSGVNFQYKTYRKRWNEVEGWGSVSTPFGSFASTLKMRTVIEQTDTIISDTLTIAVPTLTTVEYTWWDPAYGIPVLKATANVVAGLEVINQVSFIDTLRCLEPTASILAVPPFATIDSASGEANVIFFEFSNNADQLSWDFGDGSTATGENPNHAYTSAGIYPVTLIACNNVCNPPQCDTAVFNVIIYDGQNPNANFILLPGSEVCVGDSLFTGNFSTNADSFVWNFGNGVSSSEVSPRIGYGSAGTYQVQLIAFGPNGSDTTVRDIDVFDAPVPSLGGDTTINSSDSISFTLSGYESYDWFDGSDDSTLTIQGTSLGVGVHTIWVEVENEGGCEGRDSLVLTILPSTSIDPEFLGNFSIYPNPTTAFTEIDLRRPTQNAIQLTLLDMQGRVVFKDRFEASGYQLSLADYPAGIYLLRLNEGIREAYFRLVKVDQ